MDLYRELELQDCPYCGGAGLLEEENGWCWYVMCMDCGAQTAPFAGFAGNGQLGHRSKASFKVFQIYVTPFVEIVNNRTKKMPET